MLFYTPDKLVYESASMINDTSFIESFKTHEDFEREYNEQCRIINESCYKKILEVKNKPELIEQIISESEENIIVRFFKFIFNAVKSLFTGIANFIKDLFGGSSSSSSTSTIQKAEETKKEIKKAETKIENIVNDVKFRASGMKDDTKKLMDYLNTYRKYRNSISIDVPDISSISDMLVDEKVINEMNLTFENLVNTFRIVSTHIKERPQMTEIDILNLFKQCDFYRVIDYSYSFGMDKLQSHKDSVDKSKLFFSIKHNSYSGLGYPFIEKFVNDFMRLDKEIENMRKCEIKFNTFNGDIFDVTHSVQKINPIKTSMNRFSNNTIRFSRNVKSIEAKMEDALKEITNIPNNIVSAIRFIASDYYNAIRKYINMVTLKISLIQKYDSFYEVTIEKLQSYNKESLRKMSNENVADTPKKFDFNMKEYMKDKLTKRDASEVTSNSEDFNRFMSDKNSTLVFQ